MFLITFALVAMCPETVAGSINGFDNSGYKGVHHCARNYGTIAVKEQPMSHDAKYTLSQIGLAYFTSLPLSRHLASRSGCFTLVAYESSASFIMKVEVLPPITKTPLDDIVMATVTDISELYEFQVTLTIVYSKTGQTVASATGVGNGNDFVMGTDLIEGIRGRINGSDKTKEMKIIATGFVDAFNQLVPFIENLPVKF